MPSSGSITSPFPERMNVPLASKHYSAAMRQRQKWRSAGLHVQNAGGPTQGAVRKIEVRILTAETFLLCDFVERENPVPGGGHRSLDPAIAVVNAVASGRRREIEV